MVYGMGMRQEDTGNLPPTPVPPALRGPLCQSMQQSSEDQRASESSPLPWQTWAPVRNDNANVWKHWGAWYTMLQTLGCVWAWGYLQDQLVTGSSDQQTSGHSSTIRELIAQVRNPGFNFWLAPLPGYSQILSCSRFFFMAARGWE